VLAVGDAGYSDPATRSAIPAYDDGQCRGKHRLEHFGDGQVGTRADSPGAPFEAEPNPHLMTKLRGGQSPATMQRPSTPLPADTKTISRSIT